MGIDLAKLRAAYPIVRVADTVMPGALIRVGSGHEWRGHCPCCSPSDAGKPHKGSKFKVDAAKNSFHCFDCKESGGALDLFARVRMHGVDVKAHFLQVATQLIETMGGSVDQFETLPAPGERGRGGGGGGGRRKADGTPWLSEARYAAEAAKEVWGLVAHATRADLWTRLPAATRDRLEAAGLTAAMLEPLPLGYLDSASGLLDHLRIDKGITMRKLAAAGLDRRAESQLQPGWVMLRTTATGVRSGLAQQRPEGTWFHVATPGATEAPGALTMLRARGGRAVDRHLLLVPSLSTALRVTAALSAAQLTSIGVQVWADGDTTPVADRLHGMERAPILLAGPTTPAKAIARVATEVLPAGAGLRVATVSGALDADALRALTITAPDIATWMNAQRIGLSAHSDAQLVAARLAPLVASIADPLVQGVYARRLGVPRTTASAAAVTPADRAAIGAAIDNAMAIARGG